MRIETEVKLDYKDVLIRPKRSRLISRSQVDIARTLKFPHSAHVWTGVPIIAANMDTVGTMEMARALSRHGIMTALHKFYDSPAYQTFLDTAPGDDVPVNNTDAVFFSFGITERDMEKMDAVMALKGNHGAPRYICLDVANGYSEPFAECVKRVRDN